MDSHQLHTPRLLLRGFRETDGPALYAYLSRPETVEYEPYGVQSFQQCAEIALRRSEDPDFWAICLPDSGELIGNIYLHRVEPAVWLTEEVGYVLNPDHWGHGYATEAVGALLDEAFRSWGVHRVIAQCPAPSPGSWKVVEHLGFRREGHGIGSASFSTDDGGRPVWDDTYLYAVLSHEWRTGAVSAGG